MDKIYESIRKKIVEWNQYDTNKPTSDYWENQEEQDEYRRWNDRDCVLTGGNLYADTMFSLWTPLRATIERLHTPDEIAAVGNIKSKYAFIREVLKGNNLEKMLPETESIVQKLSQLFELGMGRENVFLLPDRNLNPARARRPFCDYIPVFLLECFPGGEFADAWNNTEEYVSWVKKENLHVFFDGDIMPENIRDLAGSGDIRMTQAPTGVAPMEKMIEQYINILQERRKCFTKEELQEAKIKGELLEEQCRMKEFRSRLQAGDAQAVELRNKIMGA